MKKHILGILFLLLCLWLLARAWSGELAVVPLSTPERIPTPPVIATSTLPIVTPLPSEVPREEDEEFPEEELTPLITGIPPLNTAAPAASSPQTDPGPTIPPPLQALQELQNIGDNEVPIKLLSGPPDESGPSSGSSTGPSIQGTPFAKSSLARVTGQPRGFVMLNLMHPKARPSIERQVQILLDSQLTDLYIGVLIDGTFTFDAPYLNSVIERLNTEKRRLVLELYLVSGPTMRRHETTPIITDFSQTHPEDFRYYIQYDRGKREIFKKIAQRALPFFELNKSLNEANINLVSVMLEDNLDSESYRAARSIAQSVLSDKAIFIRNACPGCFPGNDTDSFGDPLEFHDLKGFNNLRRQDGFTMDGLGYRYPNEPVSSALTVESTKQMIIVSEAEDHKFFGLWRADRQGLGGKATQAVHPDDRNYAVPTEEQARIDIEILREGLDPNPTPTPSE